MQRFWKELQKLELNMNWTILWKNGNFVLFFFVFCWKWTNNALMIPSIFWHVPWKKGQTNIILWTNNSWHPCCEPFCYICLLPVAAVRSIFHPVHSFLFSVALLILTIKLKNNNIKQASETAFVMKIHLLCHIVDWSGPLSWSWSGWFRRFKHYVSHQNHPNHENG